MSAPAVVALGGGHGLAVSLAALRRLTERLTAVVTVADDGGSSGRLRRELGAVPPGDLRMALAALAGEEPTARVWVRAVQHRFGGQGALGGHALGNLLLVALTEVLGGDLVAALDQAGRLLGLPGRTRVLPLCTQPLHIEADVTGLAPAPVTVHGQVAVASTRGRVAAVRLRPVDAAACPEAVQAVRTAAAVVLGPGSLFTSVLPHLLLPAMGSAVRQSPGRRVLVLNLAPQPGETEGFSSARHLEALAEQVPGLTLDVVLADRASVESPDRLREAAAALGAQVRLAEVADLRRPGVHDPGLLAAALRPLLGVGPGARHAPSTPSAGPGPARPERSAPAWPR